MKAIRKAGIQRMPFCKRALIQVRVFPIQDHYYEPPFDSGLLRRPLDQNRDLPGVDWNTDEQLYLLKSFCFNEELKVVPATKVDELYFHFNNGANPTSNVSWRV